MTYNPAGTLFAILALDGEVLDIEELSALGVERGYEPDGLFTIAQPDWVVGGVFKNGAYEAPQKPMPVEDDYRLAITTLLDNQAKRLGYDDRLSIATYVGSVIEKYDIEARLYIEWRDRIWFYVNEELKRVLQGERPQPTIAELLDELPPLTLPF